MTEQGTTPHAMGYGTYLKAWVYMLLGLFLTSLLLFGLIIPDGRAM